VQLATSKGYDGGMTVGQRQFWVYWGLGPASYNPVTGDQLTVPAGVYIDSVDTCMDTTGTYIAVPYPSAVKTTRATWKFQYFTASGMVAVPNGTNLSAYSFQFGVWGGEF
jgi:hypothetical protein